MPTATAKKRKYVQVIQEGWYSGGIYRRMGEVLRARGINVGLMKREGYLADLDEEDNENICECDFEGCADEMVRVGFDDEDQGEMTGTLTMGKRSTYPVERLARKAGAGPRMFVSDDALQSHKMQDHGMDYVAGAEAVPGGPPSTPDPGEKAASPAALEAATQAEVERKRVR